MLQRRLTVYLRAEEHDALVTLAERDRRDVRDEAAILIRNELERGRLLRRRGPTVEQQVAP